MTDRKITLSPRLLTVSKMVRPGMRVADIGTDHAYLPAWLVLEGVCESAIAADLREKPLENAKETVDRYALGDKIKLILSDGLERIPQNETDDIVLAGMGGDLICDILSAAPWVKDKKYRIIAQPQTHHERVRGFFMENGFEIIEENACTDSGKCYVCLCAEYTGEKKEYPFGYEFYGEMPKCESVYADEFFTHQINRLRKRAAGLSSAGQAGEEVAYLNKLSEKLEEIRKERQNGKG